MRKIMRINPYETCQSSFNCCNKLQRKTKTFLSPTRCFRTVIDYVYQKHIFDLIKFRTKQHEVSETNDTKYLYEFVTVNL